MYQQAQQPQSPGRNLAVAVEAVSVDVVALAEAWPSTITLPEMVKPDGPVAKHRSLSSTSWLWFRVVNRAVGCSLWTTYLTLVLGECLGSALC